MAECIGRQGTEILLDIIGLLHLTVMLVVVFLGPSSPMPSQNALIQIIQPTSNPASFRQLDDVEIKCQLLNFPSSTTLSWFFSTSPDLSGSTEVVTHLDIHNPLKYDVEAVETMTTTWMFQILHIQPQDEGFYACMAQDGDNGTSDSRLPDSINRRASIEIHVTEPVRIHADVSQAYAYLGFNHTMSWRISGRPLPKRNELNLALHRSFTDRGRLILDDRHILTLNRTDARTLSVKLTIIEVDARDVGTYILSAGSPILGPMASIILESLEPPAITEGKTEPSGSSNSADVRTDKPSKPTTTTATSENPENALTEQQMIYIIAGVVSGLLGIGLFIGVICFCKRQTCNKREESYYKSSLPYHAQPRAIHQGHVNRGYEDINSFVLHGGVAETYSYTSLKEDKYDFPRSRLRFLDEVGSGKFGHIVLAEALNILGDSKWTTVAVKMAKDTATDFEKEDIRNELDIMKVVPRHINVITFLGCCAKADPLLIIMEYIPHGNLQSYLRKSRPGHIRSSKYRQMSSRTLNAKDLTQFSWQIAKGMTHLASCKIIHRDLAARNILIGENRVCKIADFGLARSVDERNIYERRSSGPLPIRWMAPETFHDALYTTKSDVWSYGILLWEIVTLGASPYPGQTGEQVMNSVLQGKIMPRPVHCTDDLYTIMRLCWLMKHETRPSFTDVVQLIEKLLESNEDYIELKEYDESEYMVIPPSSTERC